MIFQILGAGVAIAILLLPDNLADLVKPREKSDEHEKPRNRNRRGRRGRRAGGTRSQSDAGKLVGNPDTTQETTNDAIREDRSGGPAGGGGGEPHSASQGASGLTPPAPESVAGTETDATS